MHRMPMTGISFAATPPLTNPPRHDTLTNAPFTMGLNVAGPVLGHRLRTGHSTQEGPPVRQSCRCRTQTQAHPALSRSIGDGQVRRHVVLLLGEVASSWPSVSPLQCSLLLLSTHTASLEPSASLEPIFFVYLLLRILLRSVCSRVRRSPSNGSGGNPQKTLHRLLLFLSTPATCPESTTASPLLLHRAPAHNVLFIWGNRPQQLVIPPLSPVALADQPSAEPTGPQQTPRSRLPLCRPHNFSHANAISHPRRHRTCLQLLHTQLLCPARPSGAAWARIPARELGCSFWRVLFPFSWRVRRKWGRRRRRAPRGSVKSHMGCEHP